MGDEPPLEPGRRILMTLRTGSAKDHDWKGRIVRCRTIVPEEACYHFGWHLGGWRGFHVGRGRVRIHLSNNRAISGVGGMED
ncbi:hypothetical protein GCM10023212_03450 [Luteolibacter yonseiensis]